MGAAVSFFRIGKSVFKITFLIAIATIALRAQATAGPVEYVKLCNMYGTGFVNLSGTDTCMRGSLGGQVGYGGTTTNFNVSPPFDVNGSGFVYGFSGMVLAGIPHTHLSLGSRISVFGGDMSGSTFYAGSGNTYEVRTRGILTGDIVVQYAPESWRSFAGRAFIGIADVRTQTEYGVVRTFTGFDTSTNTGITAGDSIAVGSRRPG
jgi:hypothetical protein